MVDRSEHGRTAHRHALNATRWVNSTRARVDDARTWAERTLVWRLWERLVEDEWIERSVALGAKAFVSLFPAIIVIASFMPSGVRRSILDTITNRAGLRGNGLNTVHEAFATTSDVRRATGLVGLFFTFFFISSFTTALQRIYTRAWRRPPGRAVSAHVVGAGWLAGVVMYCSLLGLLRAALGGGPATAFFVVLVWLAAIGAWIVTPWIMLLRQVPMRLLLVTGLVTGTGLVLYAGSASIWMPRTVADNQHQFGFFGVALALVTWLTGAAMIIVAGACIAPVLAEDRGFIGALVRGRKRDEPGLTPPR